MGFQLSPGVNVSEVDLTNIVPAVDSSGGGFVGEFHWGPVMDYTIVSDKGALEAKFGKPSDSNFTDWYSAANFLAYSSNLNLIRVVDESDALNASADGLGVLVKNQAHYDLIASGAAAAIFAAKYPGALGNALSVHVADAATFDGWAYENEFDGAPGTSDYAIAKGAANANDEIHVVVVDRTGAFTGQPGTILERFAYLSVAKGAKTLDNEPNYYANIINKQSEYIWVMGAPADSDFVALDDTAWGSDVVADTVFNVLTAALDKPLSAGSDGSAVTSAELIDGWDMFTNAEVVDVSLLFVGDAGGSANSVAVIQHVIGIADSRKDVMVFFSPDKVDVFNVDMATATENVVAFRNSVNSASSYAVMDSGWKRQYDAYNDVYRWLPLNADIAGLVARTDDVADPWYSPAGYTRGQIKNTLALALNPDKTSRDALYKVGVNPVVSFVGEGVVLYGDRTQNVKSGAFSKINIRRLFIVLEKAIAIAAKSQLFEFNDEFTRSQFRNMVEPFLTEVQSRRGVDEFRVVCDSSNNTGEVISQSQFVADIYIKPAYSINFIQLNFVAVRQGVEFDEVVGVA